MAQRGSTGLTAEERATIVQAQDKAEALLDGVKQGEAAEAAKLQAGSSKKSATESEPVQDVHQSGPGKPIGKAARIDSKKVVAGGKHEIHVTKDRIEVCPVQLCPDLKDAVGSGGADPKVEKEVNHAQEARLGGDGPTAAKLSEQALIDAGVATSSARQASSVVTDAAKRMETLVAELDLRIKSRRMRDALGADPYGGHARGELEQELRELITEAKGAKTSAVDAARANNVKPDPVLVDMAMDEVHQAMGKARLLDETVERIERHHIKPVVVEPGPPPSPADRAFAHDVHLSPDNPAVPHRQMTCREFISTFRQPGVESVFPGDYLPRTVGEALTDVAAPTVVRKMLTDGRFAK